MAPVAGERRGGAEAVEAAAPPGVPEAVVRALTAALAPLAEALGAAIVARDEMAEGDVPVPWEGVVVLGFRLPGLHGALQRMLANIEREEGCPLDKLSREDKQRVVHQLEAAGAFTIRKAVEEVADALGASRFTIYNYLNRSDPGS
jgi:hypothetical protein